MKKYSITIILLVFLSTFCLTDCEQEKKEEVPVQAGIIDELDSGAHAHLIVLRVNTAEFNDPDNNNKWKFKGQKTEPDSLFTTEVGPGDRVIWVGVSSSSIEDKVEITKIKHIHGEQLLTRRTLTGRNGVVIGDIVHDADPGAVGKYELDFTVEIEGKLVPDTTNIDPKLRIHD